MLPTGTVGGPSPAWAGKPIKAEGGQRTLEVQAGKPSEGTSLAAFVGVHPRVGGETVCSRRA